MKDKFTLYLLHSSHTDVGYTDTQEKMKAHHISFIREVLELVEKEPRFRWNCESYWCVEQFLKVATETEKEAFAKAVKAGNIGVSASYLNLTDLVPEYVHQGIMEKCRKERESLGIETKSAMTADVNGYSWGFADILAKQGVEHLMSCIHTHHGYHPLFRKQTPFYWESPEERRLLVWNGEHYNFGNELGMAQAAWFEYTLQDGMTFVNASPYEKAVRRIHAYVDTILEQGYEYNFAPVSLSGNMTDNSPPSVKILEFADRFNADDTEIVLEMCTLDTFFEKVKATGKEIPVYRGDWTDWWADGVGSTPADVIQYRRAARTYHVAKKIDADETLGSQKEYASALYNLMLFVEHTWGYSSSITEPYHPQVNNLDQWKRLYALKACESATIVKEEIQQHYGETAISLHKQLKFRAVNPHETDIEEMFTIDLEHFYGYQHFTVEEEETGKTVPFQLSRYSRGSKLCLWLKMEPKEVKTFVLKELPHLKLNSAGLKALTGIECVDDLHWRNHAATTKGIETPYFKITYQKDLGVTSVYDKIREQELLESDALYGAFTPIHEVTPRDIGEDYLFVRRNMGRNRKAFRTKRSIGKLYDVKVLEEGALFAKVELKYEMEGVTECSVILTVYQLSPRMSVDFRLHKESIWEPENVYLAMPFAKKEFYIDKTAAIVRPRIDQLPGTCTDFYALQNGMLFAGEMSQIIITSPDVPLIMMGDIEAHPIRLMGEEGVENNDRVYSWVMNNFWETNFKASLGGFYQFRYEVAVTDSIDPDDAFKQAEAMNEGTLQFYLFEDMKEKR